MRRSPLLAPVLAVVSLVALLGPSAACSSSDEPDAAVLEEATVEGGVALALDGASSSDAKTQADGSVAPLADAAQADSATGATFSGEATYYDADGTGACGFKATPNDLNVAAMNKAQYGKSWCGKCVLVTGPKGTVKVRIVDLCPGCAKGDLDLSEQAFAAIASLSAGRVKITWHAVSC